MAELQLADPIKAEYEREGPITIRPRDPLVTSIWEITQATRQQRRREGLSAGILDHLGVELQDAFPGERVAPQDRDELASIVVEDPRMFIGHVHLQRQAWLASVFASGSPFACRTHDG